MKLSLVLPTGLALAAAAVFTGGNTTEGYALLGHSLDLNQRDFRVFNGFTNSGANDNTTPHPEFPGATGAVMAIWKGAIEWGSRLHGTGSGDSTQNGGLGSGGANFDPSFQGEANVVGNIGDNICSNISGNSGGVLAYVESTGSGNWRMRFYTGWNWADGPGSIGFSQMDIQSVACHEYGHSLGLGHSGTGAATMAPSTSNGQTGPRSIHSDDIAGVQAIYGAASASKPIITSISSINIGSITINGSNFAATNEVWFTREDFQGNGTPLKVLNVPSTNGGTEITVNVPSNARGGDILVRKTGLNGGNALSNAWPFDVTTTQCPSNEIVCTNLPNSTGVPGTLSVFGSQNIAMNDTILAAGSLPPGEFGIFIYGQGDQLLFVSDGFLCINGSQFYRLDVVQVDMFGQVAYALDLNDLPPGGEISAGETWNFQLWHRDTPAGSGHANFSNAVSHTWCE